MNRIKTLLFLSATLALPACVHKPNIEQGNVVTPTQVSRLHPGMRMEDVKTLLGNPLMQEPFNQNRLQYVYTLQKGREQGTGMRLTLLFKQHKLTKIEHEPSFPLTG